MTQTTITAANNLIDVIFFAGATATDEIGELRALLPGKDELIDEFVRVTDAILDANVSTFDEEEELDAMQDYQGELIDSILG
jgi:hypothetical protein